jgi:hypothetical protein
MVLLGFTKKVKAAIRFFSPVMSVILLASVLALFATLSQTQVEATVFTAEEDAGTVSNAGAGIGNTLLFLLPAILGSFAIVYVVRSGKKRLLKYIFRGALTFTTGIILAFFLFKLAETMSERAWYILWDPTLELSVMTIPFSDYDLLGFLICGLLTGYAVVSMVFSRGFRRSERNGSLIVISAFMGAFMAVILPTWTVVFLLIALALWDIYAVFKGPIKDMVELEMNGQLMARFDPLGDDSDDFPFENMTYDAGSWQLGIGDLVFYSMLGAHALFYSTIYVSDKGWWMLPFFFVPVLIAILIGFAYTIYRLTKGDGTSILPGLPIPMFLGVGTFALMMAIARWVI